MVRTRRSSVGVGSPPQKRARVQSGGSAAVNKPYPAAADGVVRKPKAIPKVPSLRELYSKTLEVLLTGAQADMKQDTLAGRDAEVSTMRKFIDTCIKSQQGNSLYVCGSPGTGKSATASYIISQYRNKSSSKRTTSIYINAVALSSPSHIYGTIHRSLEKSASTCSHSASRNRLPALMKKSKNMILLVVDEMDALRSSDSVLYDLFEWAGTEDSRLILVGIANDMTLLEKHLPKLNALRCEPEVQVFTTYSHEQLIGILEQRLKLVLDNIDRVFHPLARELIARKVKSRSGDAREFLEASRNALQVAARSFGDEWPDEEGPIVQVQHVKHAFGGGTSLSPCIAVMQQLPEFQTMALCAVALYYKHKALQLGNNLATVAQVFGVYRLMMRKLQLPGVSSNEFFDMMSNLSTSGLVSLNAGVKKQHTVELRVERSDIEFALKQREFFRELLKCDIFAN